MKQIFYYDENKILKGVDLVANDVELSENATDIVPPDGLYKAKFTGTEWVESISEQELLELNKTNAILPDSERIDALEGAMIYLANSIL